MTNPTTYVKVNDTPIDTFWDNKVKEVVRISKELGFDYLDYGFWMNQRAIILSLIIDLYEGGGNR